MSRFTNILRHSIVAVALNCVVIACFTVAAFAQFPTVTQSTCFTVTLGPASHNCASGVCGGPPDPVINSPCYPFFCGPLNPPTCPSCQWQPCSTHCMEVTICSDKCAGLDPTSFTIACSNYDQSGNCRSYCGDSACHNAGGPLNPNDAGNTCSWQGPRVILVDNQTTGIPDNGCITFVMCEAYNTTELPGGGTLPVTYTISCTPHNCPPPNGPACSDASFTW